MTECYRRLTALILSVEGLARFESDEPIREQWQEISSLEEQVASLRPASDLEGAIARRGAVTAALSADDPARALSLAKRYLEDPDVHAADNRGLLDLRHEAVSRLEAERNEQ